MFEATLILILTALPLMGSPGPATLSIAAAGAAFGVRRSLGYLAGIVLGTGTVLAVIATGVTGAILTVPGLLPVLSTLALAYILYLAYRIAKAPVGKAASERAKAPVFLGGYLLAIANPKAFTAIGAVFSSVFVLPENVFADAIIKTLILFGVIAVVQSVWLMLGVGLAAFTNDPVWGRRINWAFAALLVLSVAAVLLP